MKTKVEVGQTWQNIKRKSGITFRVSKIEGNKVYAIDSKSNSEGYFGIIDDDGYPSTNWDSGWACDPIKANNNSTSKDSNISEDRSLLDFFKGVRSGHCPCDIPIVVCKFHKV